MAVMYSRLGGCLGLTAKLGPLARTDLCAGVKGLLDRLMIQLRVRVFWGRPLREPIMVVRCGVAVQGTSTVCLGGSAVPLGKPGGSLCLAECLGCCLPDLVPWLPDWSGWEGFSLGGARWVAAWEAGECWWTAFFLGGKGSYWPACCLGDLGSLTACCTKLLPSPGWRWEPVWLPVWDKLLASPEGRLSACLGSNCLTTCLRYTTSFPKGKGNACLTACLR